MIRRALPILLLSVCCSSLFAQNKLVLPLPSDGGAASGLTVGESGEGRIRMSAKIGAISLLDTTTAKGDFCELQIDGAYMAGAEGEPQLPALRKLVRVPHGAAFTVNITHADTTFYALADYNVNAKLSPRQSSPSKSSDNPKFKYKRRSYRRNYFAEQKLVTVTPVGTMRGIDICQIAVNPVRYNPKTNTVIHILQMADFVSNQIVDDKIRSQGDSPAKT